MSDARPKEPMPCGEKMMCIISGAYPISRRTSASPLVSRS
jgi:hypothetical protein